MTSKNKTVNTRYFMFNRPDVDGALLVESLMVSAATQVSLLRRPGSHSPGHLFSLSLVEAGDGFRATFQWLNLVQLPL